MEEKLLPKGRYQVNLDPVKMVRWAGLFPGLNEIERDKLGRGLWQFLFAQNLATRHEYFRGFDWPGVMVVPHEDQNTDPMPLRPGIPQHMVDLRVLGPLTIEEVLGSGLVDVIDMFDRLTAYLFERKLITITYE